MDDVTDPGHEEIEDSAMPKVTIDKLVPGMKLSHPLTAPNGLVLLSEGTELTEKWISRIGDMNVDFVHIEGPADPGMPREEMMARLDARFAPVETRPPMCRIKKIVREHIETLYARS